MRTERPDPEAAVAVHRHESRHESRQGAMATGLGAAGCAFVPLTGPTLLPLFVDMPGWLEAAQNPFVVMELGVLLGVLLVFVLTAMASYRRRLHSG